MFTTYFHEQFYDMPVDTAQKYADVIREAILTGKAFEGEKKQGFFLSKERGFDDKLYVGNIHRIESHLYWNDEELSDDDQIVNVVVIDGPVTRDGDGCSYGSKDIRDQILYANTIDQVVGHIFILNTPGGAASARIDFEQAIADCREKGKSTVAWVDGMCCSAGQLVAALCDRTIVMNGRHTMGCIGTMCAFWGVPNGTVDRDGYRYIELVSVTSPDKNAEYREAVEGDSARLQAELDKLGEEFRETVRQNRPLVKEEMLTGKTYDADEVMGALVDEIGDYSRAIEAVFDLAGEKLQPARLAATPEPEPDGEEDPEEEPAGSQDMQQLTEEQRAAMAANPGETLIVGDKKVTKVVQTMFGPTEQEIGNNNQPQNNENMPENEEKKVTEAVAAEEATTQEVEQTEQQPEAEVPATEAPAATEEAPATEAPAAEEGEGDEPQQEADPAPEGEGDPAEGDQAPEGEGDAPKAEEEPAPAAPEPEAAPQQEAETERINEALHEAESLVQQRDEQIQTLTTEKDSLQQSLQKKEEELTAKDEQIVKLQAEVEKLTKENANLKAEVKEFSDKPAPMVDGAAAGIPAGNGTGKAPEAVQKTQIKRGMSYAEIRALKLKQLSEK